MHGRNLFVLLVSIAIVSVSCYQPLNDTDVLATAFGKNLYKSNIDFVGQGLTKNDSMDLQTSFVNNWLMDEILLKEAKSNIKDAKELDELVTKYKNSIYIHELEKNYLAENLDTVISQNEIDTFYSQHNEQLLLSEPIVQILLVIVDNKFYNDTLKMIWKTEDLPALNSYLKLHKGQGLLNVGEWNYKSKIKAILPPDLYSVINFNKKETYSYDMQGKRYLIKVIDKIKKEEPSPKNFIIENIKERILHVRSKQLINNWKQSLYNTNIQSKHIHISESN